MIKKWSIKTELESTRLLVYTSVSTTHTGYGFDQLVVTMQLYVVCEALDTT